MGWGEYRPPAPGQGIVTSVDRGSGRPTQLPALGERAHRVIVDEPAWCQRCQLPIPTEATPAPLEAPLPAVRVECLIDHGPFTGWERLSRRWRDRIHRPRHMARHQP